MTPERQQVKDQLLHFLNERKRTVAGHDGFHVQAYDNAASITALLKAAGGPISVTQASVAVGGTSARGKSWAVDGVRFVISQRLVDSFTKGRATFVERIRDPELRARLEALLDDWVVADNLDPTKDRAAVLAEQAAIASMWADDI